MIDSYPGTRFIPEDEKVLYDELRSEILARGVGLDGLPSMELAGPREKIFFDPSKSRAAVVSCGGLCPGLNDVIRGIVMGLHFLYGVRKVYGFQFGYEGFIAKYRHEALVLTPDSTDQINEQGGTILGSSRGEQDPVEVVDCLDRMDVNLFFPIGGDGTMRGAIAIQKEIDKRQLNIAVVGIPKTIDNDICYTQTSFGYRTAYSAAVESIRSAHVEARGAPNGVGIVRLMGRHSGFIACSATLAMPEANFVLIPEVKFDLEGPKGFLACLKRRLERRGHAVVVVAEGAGQDLIAGEEGKDASGNERLKDIGIFLRDRVTDYMKKENVTANVKYIDPSYNIRSVPAIPVDGVYCGRLAKHAVHAAMSGRTGMLIGHWHEAFVHVPLATAISVRNKVDPMGDLWQGVLESTGQPSLRND